MRNWSSWRRIPTPTTQTPPSCKDGQVTGCGRVIAACAGDGMAAHRAGCAWLAERGLVPIPEQADIVIVGTGGFPKDINVYQAQKALDNSTAPNHTFVFPHSQS